MDKQINDDSLIEKVDDIYYRWAGINLGVSACYPYTYNNYQQMEAAERSEQKAWIALLVGILFTFISGGLSAMHKIPNFVPNLVIGYDFIVLLLVFYFAYKYSRLKSVSGRSPEFEASWAKFKKTFKIEDLADYPSRWVMRHHVEDYLRREYVKDRNSFLDMHALGYEFGFCHINSSQYHPSSP